MFSMEMEAERRREVIAGTTGHDRRHSVESDDKDGGWSYTADDSVRTATSRPCEDSVPAPQPLHG